MVLAEQLLLHEIANTARPANKSFIVFIINNFN